MPTKKIRGFRLDARPDRIDYRDRLYDPPLVSLPEQYPSAQFIEEHLANYTADLILDQGEEGACTGFGLAAVINYLLWKDSLNGGIEPACVSPRMLYRMARIYDEWPGEDYEGSSCRGAMKGWHRHGVCTDKLWPHRSGQKAPSFVRPKTGWRQDAARRPLGAYYRINGNSIADMQAALHEVGAIYVSADVHPGWFIKKSDDLPRIKIPRRKLKPEDIGGHAFALVGYLPDGFIVQNSWGPDWGYSGFAVLPYEDWVKNGADAWVAVLGAAMSVSKVPGTRTRFQLRPTSAGRAGAARPNDEVDGANADASEHVQPLSEEEAYEQTVVLGNNGRPLNQFLHLETGEEAIREASFVRPLAWLQERKSVKLAVYAHGGLNDEEDSIKRIRVMAPYFRENDIYPLFVTWKTGFLETIRSGLDDAVEQLIPGDRRHAGGLLDRIRQQIAEVRDRSIEVACENLLIKPIWLQIKQNAAAAAGTTQGLSLMLNQLKRLATQIPKLEIHIVGHSAGSILSGHLLDRMAAKKLRAVTCTQYAPACTVRFALQHYKRAVEREVVDKEAIHVDLLSDERELADSIGPYGKSLLYLVSRALEDHHKEPLLGMEGAWSEKAETDDMWNRATLDDVRQWREFCGDALKPAIYRNKTVRTSTSGDTILLSHGSFDNDIDVVTATLQRIRGGKLKTKVEVLQGF